MIDAPVDEGEVLRGEGGGWDEVVCAVRADGIGVVELFDFEDWKNQIWFSPMDRANYSQSKGNIVFRNSLARAL